MGFPCAVALCGHGASKIASTDRGAGDVVLDQARLRGAKMHRRRLDAETINLGNEPPLSVDGGTGSLVDRRRLSVQWFSGTILTGLCGAALMGGAVFASLDGETNFACAPEHVEWRCAARSPASAAPERIAQDRPPRRAQRTERRAPDRAGADLHARGCAIAKWSGCAPYVRVTGNLSLTVTEISANIPPFNPQKLLPTAWRRRPAGRKPSRTPRSPSSPAISRQRRRARSQGDRRRCCDSQFAAGRRSSPPRCCRSMKSSPACAPSPQTAGPGLQTPTERRLDAQHQDELRRRGRYQPFFGFQPRVVPENVTLLPKTKSIAVRRRRLERAPCRRQERRDGRLGAARARRRARTRSRASSR